MTFRRITDKIKWIITGKIRRLWISGDNYMNYTYIIKCADSTLYTGWTNDLDKRIKAHNSGKGAKYTKTRRPVKLVYYEEHETKNEAMSREYAIKQLTRREKELLIQGNGNLCEKECG